MQANEERVISNGHASSNPADLCHDWPPGFTHPYQVCITTDLLLWPGHVLPLAKRWPQGEILSYQVTYTISIWP